MSKLVVSIAAVSIVCACGLVIDPDKLTEGSTAGDGPDATDAADDTSVVDASFDGRDEED